VVPPRRIGLVTQRRFVITVNGPLVDYRCAEFFPPRLLLAFSPGQV